MNKALNTYYAAKAWWGGVMAALTGLSTAIQASLADDAVSLTEVRGIIMLGTTLVGAVLSFSAVWAARNAGTDVPMTPPDVAQVNKPRS